MSSVNYPENCLNNISLSAIDIAETNETRMNVFDQPASLVASLFQDRWNADFHTNFNYFDELQ